MWSIVKEMYGKNLGLTEEEEASLAGGAAIARGGAGAGEFELETLEESEEALLASSSFPALGKCAWEPRILTLFNPILPVFS